MKAILPYQHMFSITGIPRSGTTILNTLFNSLDNGFSISEPLLGLFNDPKSVSSGKINIDLNRNPYLVLDQLNKFLQENNNYDLGGIKEVFNPEEDSYEVYSNSEYINFVVIIIRNPLYVFNSWFLCKWKDKYNQVEYLKWLYESLIDFYKKTMQEKPVYVISYEKLISDKINHINDAFSGYMNIEGNLKLKDSKFSLGDPLALKSNDILKLDRSLLPQVLHSDNYYYIKDNISPLHEELQSYI
jgi:hypothetical protein